MYNLVFNPNLTSDDVFGMWYIGSHIKRARDRKFRHLEKFQKGYKRKK